jgi:sugar lactone lactonase YvrE
MSQQARYTAPPASLAEGWTLQRLTAPSRLFGANGLRTGPDSRIYVAQVSGSQISALDVNSGTLQTVSAKGSEIIAPDDVAFDPHGNLYATEVMDARVSVLEHSGRTRVLRDDVPCANGITVHQGRLFIGECRIGGRLLELDLNGGAPRVLLEDVPMPNAMEVGPDGMLYFPVMGANEIWRVNPEGGKAEKVADGLGVPDSVKFDAQGYIVSTQVHSGQVLRIDPRNGEKTVLAQLDPGLDNCTFVGERLFVSSLTGTITEILGGGQSRTVLPGGLNWPLDLTVDAGGQLYIADNTHFYALQPDGSLRTLGMMFTPGFPGSVRGAVALGPDEFLLTNTSGQVTRWCPSRAKGEALAQGLDQLYGIAVAPGGAVVVAELGAGRVLAIEPGQATPLASGLRQPMGVAIDGNGDVLVSECGAGRVVRLSGGKVEPVMEGLQQPHGILVRDHVLYVVDAAAKTLTALDLKTRQRQVIAAKLPVGAPPGVTAKPLRGLPPFSGPLGPFSGIAAGPDGTLYVSADADGSVLALRCAPLNS